MKRKKEKKNDVFLDKTANANKKDLKIKAISLTRRWNKMQKIEKNIWIYIT